INHAGFTFASGNADDLKDKIIGLYNHQELLEEKGRAALEIIKEKFSWDTIADETEKVYKELVGS
ncbi:MAG: hypothetical protein Q8M83_03780, partial [bacterium]|nr:hypothetical protein [bacterium]